MAGPNVKKSKIHEHLDINKKFRELKQLVAVFSEGASWRVGSLKEPKDKT